MVEVEILLAVKDIDIVFAAHASVELWVKDTLLKAILLEHVLLSCLFWDRLVSSLCSRFVPKESSKRDTENSFFSVSTRSIPFQSARTPSSEVESSKSKTWVLDIPSSH